MNVRKEIELYSADADKPVLNWLFDRYHYASQWNFVATCEFSRPHFHRIWSPTRAGLKLFAHDELVAAVKQAERWMRNIPTDEQFDCAAYGESITVREICAQLAFVLRKATAQ